jgi:hypothetical protein
MTDTPRDETRWSLWRQDDHGSRFAVARGLSRDEAERELARREASGHKQTWWLEPTR